MKNIFFITGNINKFKEAKQIFPDLKRADIDLPEIQEICSKEIIKAKLIEGMKRGKKPIIVEDVSFTLDCLNGLPGPLIKWFLKTIKPEGIYKLAKKHNNTKATVTAMIGYASTKKNIKFFDATIKGTVVSPIGKEGFGFDPIFIPKGHVKTFAQMSMEEKNKISMRKKALSKLKNFLNKK